MQIRVCVEFPRYEVVEIFVIGSICESQPCYRRIDVCGGGGSWRRRAQLRSCCLSRHESEPKVQLVFIIQLQDESGN